MDIPHDREYTRSHPWIAFRVDLSRAPHTLWLLLGEAASQIQHIEGSPLHPEAAEELQRVFLAKGVRATTAIEGNTLSEEQVRQRLEGTLELPPSQEYLGQEVDNIVEAVNRVTEHQLSAGPTLLTTDMIKEFNRLVLKDLPVAEDVTPGAIRTHSVAVGNYLAAPPGDCHYLLDRLVAWLNSPDFDPPVASPAIRITHAVLKAIVAHLYLAWIHPFGDGNGRTSRLLEFQILISSGVPLPAAHLLSNHYNLTRSEYYRQLDKASRSGGEVVPFVHYAVQGLVDGLREQIQRISTQQMQVTREHLVYTAFKDGKSPAVQRRRALLIELGQHMEPLPKSAISSLSPTLAMEYASKTDKTLSRDLNFLEKIDLLERGPDGWRARIEVAYGFLPKG